MRYGDERTLLRARIKRRFGIRRTFRYERVSFFRGNETGVHDRVRGVFQLAELEGHLRIRKDLLLTRLQARALRLDGDQLGIYVLHLGDDGEYLHFVLDRVVIFVEFYEPVFLFEIEFRCIFLVEKPVLLDHFLQETDSESQTQKFGFVFLPAGGLLPESGVLDLLGAGNFNRAAFHEQFKELAAIAFVRDKAHFTHSNDRHTSL